MYDYNLCKNRDILCVDLKSFFASVSCIKKGLDPLTSKLAVVGNTKRQGSVVLAATPPLKKMGIKTGSRLFEIPNHSDIYITNPQMRTYLNVSTKISRIILNYVPHVDFLQYSIDEAMLDITDSYHLFADSPYELARLIQKEIYKQTNIKSTVGIGSNILLAKVSMDIEAKHTKEGIAEWRYQDVPTKLWPIDNLIDFWGINTKTAKKLNKRGIFTVGDLANYPHVYLKRDFGQIGVDLHLHANGIDESIIRQPYKVQNKALGKSQVLLRDYSLNELKTVLIEQIEDVYFRTRMKDVYPTTISVSVGYSEGGGIKKQFTEKNGFKSTTQIIYKLWDYIVSQIDSSALLRTIGVSFTNFRTKSIQQLELFKPEQELKAEIIDDALDKVKLKYGKEVVMRATSLTSGGTLTDRKGLLAGHKA
ncbi:DNA repair protein [Staphylococcus equorum]|uniref:DNA repair protein n=1 Tax=Staphylococcus equorum TaxID=246432 RepID=A0A9X4L5W9_9STAP|nr:DNA repair protein [Staphylococcus equorum]MDG0820655.1 DNA repair protein [Staphylococcus equorum]MDG0841280.1 DNA repair protein [Staphylococcus equorum]MDG0846980.1 DNA repair protein [Staphylococcus equorum]OEL08306.1 DNA repair protein [Staphylococcus equorum]PTE82258.1 DNA repair protein [Staphylococcus equorum]